MADRWVDCVNHTFVVKYTSMAAHVFCKTLYSHTWCDCVAEEPAAALLSDVCVSGQACWERAASQVVAPQWELASRKEWLN